MSNCNLLNCVNLKLKILEKYINKGEISFTNLKPTQGCCTIGSSTNRVCEIHTDQLFVENDTIHFTNVNSLGDEVTLKARDDGCLVTTNTDGISQLICPSGSGNNLYPDKVHQSIGNTNTEIDITTYGTTITRDAFGITAHSIPDGTFDGQLKKINVIWVGGDAYVSITSTTFEPSVYAFNLEFFSGSFYVLFRWNGSTWVDIDALGGMFTVL